MKIMSFNVNSIRARLDHVKLLLDRHQPDVLGLQEIKVSDEEFPEDQINEWGYEVIYHGQKTHYGVATLSKSKPISIQKGFDTDLESAQRRLIVARFKDEKLGEITVLNGYFPQGENRSHPTKFSDKKIFYRNLTTLLEETCQPDDPVVVLGDLNIAPGDLDIGIGDPNRKRWISEGKCAFLPEEREWYGNLEAWGLTDTYRMMNPDDGQAFSWFDYRSKGFDRDPRRGLRIDLILASSPLAKQCNNVGIDYAVRGMERPSDHCPIWAEFR